MDTVLLTALLALVAKNLVEMVKHFANVGGLEDSTYTRQKGLYALLAPVLLSVFAVIAENQGAAIDLLASLGVDTGTNGVAAAIITGIVAGFAAPEMYDAGGLLKAKVRTNQVTGDAVEASLNG